MPFETSLPQIGGGAFLAVLAYAASSLWAGQEIGERMIERSGWTPTCEAGIQADLDAERTPKHHVPEARCSDQIGWLHPELLKFCLKLRDPDFNAGQRRAEEEYHRRKRQLEDLRIGNAAAKAGSMCACAKNVYLSEEFLSLGLYAGTVRLITPSPVEDLEQGLRQSLATPQCQALGGRS